MEEIMQTMNYTVYREELRQELQKQADSFVRTGYLLRLAMDTDILKESGYYNVNEFAKAEFNIDAYTVSRYININMRFSENGYAERIAEQYRGMGYAKLSLMLLLPDTINAELTPAFSKSEIQAIKEEYEEENKITDLEVLMEGEDEGQKEMDNNLAKALHQLGMDEPDLFCRLFQTYTTHGEEYLTKGFIETLAPQGENIYNVRVRGIGRLMISVKVDSDEVAIINMRSGEKEQFPCEEVTEVLAYFMYNRGTQGSEVWQQLYGQPFPVKEEQKTEIAPVQQHKEQKAKKPEPRKQSRVTKAKQQEPPKEEPEKTHEPEEQIPGQDNVLNHPEYLPEGMETQDIPDEDNEPGESLKESQENADFTKSEDSSDIPAAGMEESFDIIWDRAEATEMKLCMFFDEFDEPEKRDLNTEEFKKELKTAYQTAISLAADLERMINVEKHHA